jgi:hypothetical protein
MELPIAIAKLHIIIINLSSAVVKLLTTIARAALKLASTSLNFSEGRSQVWMAMPLLKESLVLKRKLVK